MESHRTGVRPGRPICIKRDVIAEIVVVLATRHEGRGLQLVSAYTRPVSRGDVHEVVLTDDRGLRPNQTVHEIACVGFIEITQGGVIVAGDEVLIGEDALASVAGFSEADAADHPRIVLLAPERRSGFELGIGLGERLRFRSARGEHEPAPGSETVARVVLARE